MSSQNPTRKDLEDAARRYFDALRLEIEPREVPWEHWGAYVEEQTELTGRRLDDLANQQHQNRFDGEIAAKTRQMVSNSGLAIASGHASWNAAMALAARAERQRLLYGLHRLVQSTPDFEPDDPLFQGYAPSSENLVNATSPLQTLDLAPLPEARLEHSLAQTVTDYLQKRSARGLSETSVTEAKRALDWLVQAFPEADVRDLGKRELRGFRDDLQRLDRRLQGRLASFQHRLTNDPAHQLKVATQTKYWSAVKTFFSWCADEGYVETSPAAGLKLEPRKHETTRTPAPFSDAELDRFFDAPLYSGYQSAKRPHQPGSVLVRNGYWWAGVLPLFTGMRAGELSQLLPEDFVFDDAISFVRIREEDDDGVRSKTTKNIASVRDVPLVPALLTLGIREFVLARRKTFPKQRIFREFRLGTGGRKSAGMTRFWSDYLKKQGIWEEGRATHVMRHTVAARLRAAGVSDPDIGAILGHKQPGITASYGGPMPLARKLEIVSRIEYGPEFVYRLGGPFRGDKHR